MKMKMETKTKMKTKMKMKMKMRRKMEMKMKMEMERVRARERGDEDEDEDEDGEGEGEGEGVRPCQRGVACLWWLMVGGVMLEPELDHIGIAVPDIQEAAELYRALGLELADVEEVPGQGVKVGFLPVGGSTLELLAPLDEDSPIARHLERRGPGLHHICLRVADIRAVMARLREQGVRLLSDEPQSGAHGCLVCFIHPKSASGVLLELSQPPAEEE